MWAIVRHRGILCVLPDHSEIHQQSIHSYNIRKAILPQKFISPLPPCYFKVRLISVSQSKQWILRCHPRAKYAKREICCSRVPHGGRSPYGSRRIIIMSTTNICELVFHKDSLLCQWSVCFMYVHDSLSFWCMHYVMRKMNVFAKLLCLDVSDCSIMTCTWLLLQHCFYSEL